MLRGGHGGGAPKIPSFNGDDKKWTIFKSDIQNLLQWAGLRIFLNNPTAKPSPLSAPSTEMEILERQVQIAKWEEDNANLNMWIQCNLEGDAKNYVVQHASGDTLDGLRAWRVLKEKYERQGFARQKAHAETILNAYIATGRNPDDLFSEIAEAQALLAAGTPSINIQDELILVILMQKLRETHPLLYTVLSNKDNLKLDDLKEQARKMWADERYGGTKKGAINALTADYSTYDCRNCGEMGHIARNCRKPKRGAGGNKKPATSAGGNKQGGDRHGGKKRGDGEKPPAKTGMWCSHHSTNTHNTAECRSLQGKANMAQEHGKDATGGGIMENCWCASQQLKEYTSDHHEEEQHITWEQLDGIPYGSGETEVITLENTADTPVEQREEVITLTEMDDTLVESLKELDCREKIRIFEQERSLLTQEDDEGAAVEGGSHLEVQSRTELITPEDPRKQDLTREQESYKTWLGNLLLSQQDKEALDRSLKYLRAINRASDTKPGCNGYAYPATEEQQQTWDALTAQHRCVYMGDSGASAHMAGTSEGIAALVDVQPEDGWITVGGDHQLEVTGVGRLVTMLRDQDGQQIPHAFERVLIVPDLHRNLLSLTTLVQEGSVIRLKQGGSTIVFEENGPEIPLTEGSTINLEMEVGKLGSTHVAIDRASLAALWHDRLGHRHGVVVQQLGKAGLIPTGLPIHTACDICSVVKSKHVSFPPQEPEKRSKEPFERVYADLIGPVPVEETSPSGARYALLITDEATRMREVYPLSSKDETYGKLESYVQYTHKHHNRSIRALRSDGGGEFTSTKVQAMCRREGIRCETTGPYCPQQNGVGERTNGIVLTMAKAMLTHAGLTKRLWTTALAAAVYILNRTPTKALGNQIPYKALYGEDCRIDHLRTYGCRVYVHVESKQRHKLDDAARRGIFLGYHPTNRRSYLILDETTGSICYAAHVSFNEREFPARAAGSQWGQWGQEHLDEEEDDEVILTFQPPPLAQQQPPQQQAPPQQQEGQQQGEEEPLEQQHQQPVQQPVATGRPQRGHRLPERFRETANLTEEGRYTRYLPMGGGYAATEAISATERCAPSVGWAYAAALNTTSPPTSYEKAKRSPEWPEWRAATEAEMAAITANGTWTLVPRPARVKVLRTRFVYANKYNERGEVIRRKARLVVDGSRQIEGIDFGDSWAPVAQYATVRVVLATAAVEDYHIHQMDVDTAFLQSPVDEDVYVEAPQGYQKYGPNGERLVYKLHKSLYGLKQSPRNWNLTIHEWLREYGCIRSPADPCLYIIRRGDSILIIVIYVDDLLIVGNCKRMIAAFKKAISLRFKMKDLGEVKYLLGMSITRDRARKTVELTQTSYIEQMIERFRMEGCSPAATPADGVLRRSDTEETGVDVSEYRQLVGSMLYAAMMTRPDIGFAIQALSRHLHNPGKEHWVAAKRVLRYLSGTKDLGIKYGARDQGTRLIGYSDSDWANDVDTRRSTTAYVYTVTGGAVSWMSRLQATVALSSTEAEYMSACAGAQEAKHLRGVMASMGFMQEGPTVIHEDNQGCIALANNPITQQRSKHIDIRYHFTRDLISDGVIVLRYIETQHQLADILTKPLDRVKFQGLRAQVLGYGVIVK